MILIDCGNSTLKAQYWEANRLQASYIGAYKRRWPLHLKHWMQDLSATHCYLASVLDAERQTELDNCLAQRFGSDVTRFRSEARSLGVVNGYHEPERLGVDRWLALIAAADLVAGDCMVIDAGSAITLDLLRGNGQHLGGAILPGFNTSLDRFKQIFSHIDFSDTQIADKTTPGCSTETAIQLDYSQDSSDQLPDLVTRWIQLLEQNADILLSGGDACRVQRALAQPSRIVPDLVFLGMSRLARQ